MKSPGDFLGCKPKDRLLQSLGKGVSMLEVNNLCLLYAGKFNCLLEGC